MKLLGRNLVANLAGRGWAALMAVAFVPWYIHYLGIEAYGLVGFFATLQAALALLDLGLSTAINHGLATLATRDGSAANQRDLVRTMEVINWGMAALVGVMVAALAPFIATHWLDARHLDPDSVRRALVLMGIAIALRWPSNLYSGALTGLQRQPSVNLISSAGATLAHLGVIAVLAWLVPTVEAFFAWHALAAAVQTVAFGWWVRRCLPAVPGHPGRFSREVLARHWRFAVGISGISVLTLLLMQTDKIILSKLLPLEEFAYYALASTVANALLMLVNPLFTAAFPAFSAAAASGDSAGLRAGYHRSCKLAACMVLPPALTIAVFPAYLLWVWSGDHELASQAGPLLGILVLGSALNGLMNIPYAIQLAHGSTRLVLQCNLVAVLVQVPMVIGGAIFCGAGGAALGWPLLNLGYVVFVAPLIHQRFLPGAQREWLLRDTAPPLLLTSAVVAGALALAPAEPSRWMAGSWLIICAGLAAALVWYGNRTLAGRGATLT